MARPKAASVDQILAAIPNTKSPGALERWLQADPERAKRFVAVLDKARDAGAPYSAILIGWNAMHEGVDRCPVKQNQVRLMHVERARVKAQC